MAKRFGVIRTVVRSLTSQVIEHSGGSCEIFTCAEGLDCFGDVFKVELSYFVSNIGLAWEKVQKLYPGSIHYAQGGFRIIDEEMVNLISPKLSSHQGDYDYDASCFKSTIDPESIIAISGSIKNVRAFVTGESRRGAMIWLNERDDYGLVIMPDLYEHNMSPILAGAYLEYFGQCHYCSFGDGSNITMIFVTGIETP